MSEIKKTTNYDLFKFHENNRKISAANLSNIKRSIGINNLLEFRPIFVNKYMEIIDGQHRFLAAKELEVPIFYQVNEEATEEDIVLLNANQKRWLCDDYVNYYASKGHEGYVQILKFSQQNHINIGSAIRALRSTGGDEYSKLRQGGLKPLLREEIAGAQLSLSMAREIIDVIARYSSEPMGPYRSDRCVRALMNISRLDGYNHEEMKDKIVRTFDKIRPCRTERDYSNLFLETYNFGRKSRKLGED